MNRFSLRVLAILAISASATARAETETRWYGWQILIPDITVIGGAGALRASQPLLLVFLTGPVVHLGNGHPGAAAFSLLARVALPVAGGMLADAMCDVDPGEWVGCGGVVAGGILGGYAAALIIDLVLAREEKPRALSLTPTVQIGQGRALAGVGFSF
jgi:hypothetical protein